MKSTDFNGLIGLVAELEDYRRQATLNGNESKFDDAETLMAIVVARLTCFEEKWGCHALKKRHKGEAVDFNTLIGFIEDEASALEEPEGAKARSRAKDYVAQLRSQAPSRKPPDKDKGRNKGGN